MSNWQNTISAVSCSHASIVHGFDKSFQICLVSKVLVERFYVRNPVAVSYLEMSAGKHKGASHAVIPVIRFSVGSVPFQVLYKRLE